jgi:multiple sugar transport system permease protein
MWTVATAFLAPLLLMVLTSLKPEAEVLNPSSLVPRHPTLSNYLHVLSWSEEAPFGRWLLNSAFISTATTLAVLVTSSTAAYALTRLRPPGSERLLGMVVVTMMLPAQLFLVPVYLMMSRLGWLDTPAALIVPATASGFGVFMLSSFMRAIPREVEEAALIDGCSSFGVFWHVNVPLCSPSLATLAVFTFVGSWNDFAGPLIFLDSVRNYTMPVGIALYQTSYYTEYGLTLATSVMSTLPLVMVFLVFQRQIIESMSASSNKE